MARSEQVQSAVIAATADGDNTVVAATSGKKIRVLGYGLSTTTAGTVQWKSGASTAKSGAMEFVDAGGIAPGTFDPAGGGFWFETAAGEALVLSTSAGLDANGHLTYLLTS
jgi:hypothetical protein